MTGIVVVLAVMAAATAFGVWWRRRDGLMTTVEPAAEVSVEPADLLGPAELGVDLGARSTLVQFSTAFCQPCRATRAVLAHVADRTDGVVHVEIDAESHLDLVRRLNVARTPTTFVLDSRGRVVARAAGVPKLADVRAALPSGA